MRSPSFVRRSGPHCRVRLAPGFALLLGAMAYLFPFPVFCAAMLAAALHELGHLTVLWALHLPCRSVRLGLFGAQIDTPPLSCRQAVPVLLAGPAVNLLTAALPFPAAVRAVSLLLGAFNLLPIRPLDGGMLLFSFLSCRFSSPERVAAAAEGAFLALLLAAALLAGLRYALGAAPILAALLLTARLLAEKRVANHGKTR